MSHCLFGLGVMICVRRSVLYSLELRSSSRFEPSRGADWLDGASELLKLHCRDEVQYLLIKYACSVGLLQSQPS